MSLCINWQATLVYLTKEKSNVILSSACVFKLQEKWKLASTANLLTQSLSCRLSRVSFWFKSVSKIFKLLRIFFLYLEKANIPLAGHGATSFLD